MAVYVKLSKNHITKNKKYLAVFEINVSLVDVSLYYTTILFLVSIIFDAASNNIGISNSISI